MILTLGLGYDSSVVQLLDLNEERSLGTVYSVALLGGSAVLLLILALAARKRGGDDARDARWWGGLVVVFAFMAADEAAGIHESLIVPLRRALHTSGALYFAWVVRTPRSCSRPACSTLGSCFGFRAESQSAS
jgi:hypothetical protein